MKSLSLSVPILTVLCVITAMFAQEVEAKCSTKPFNPISDVAWNGIFPIRVGGVAVATNSELPDASTGTVNPICTCEDVKGTYVGMEISFWDISYMAEVVGDAYCSPVVGMKYSGLDSKGYHSGTNSKAIPSAHTFKQIHWFEFPVFHMIGMLGDLKCLQAGKDIAPGDMSETNPTYNDDYLSALKDPKIFLFANPAADIACIGKAAIAQLPGSWFPMAYDSFFWCQWDNIYPLSGNVASGSVLTSSAQIVARQVYTYTQEQAILDYTKLACKGQPSNIMKSSQWRYQFAKPVKSATPFWAAQSEFIWGGGKAPAYNDSNFLFVLFQKKKCCQKLKGAN